MSRVATTNLGLGTWPRGAKPGAGSQTVTGSKGLNDNWLILDKAVGTAINADGTFKADVIGGTSLKSNVADGTTLEYDTGTHTLRIKALGVDAAQIKAGAVTNTKLGTLSIDTTKIQDAAVTADQIAPGAISSNDKVTSYTLQGNRILRNQLIRKKYLSLGFDQTNGKILCNGIDINANFGGFYMERGGCVTAFAIKQISGTTDHVTMLYDPVGTNHFAAGKTLNVEWLTSTPDTHTPSADGSSLGGTTLRISRTLTANAIYTIEIELDD